MMTHWLRNFISLLFIVNIIKMIYMRLRVDWGVICLYFAIQISMSIKGEKGFKREKLWISFSPRNLPTLLFSCHWTISRRCWHKNLNCKYKHLTNWTQLSRKRWDWQLLWAQFINIFSMYAYNFYFNDTPDWILLLIFIEPKMLCKEF